MSKIQRNSKKTYLKLNKKIKKLRLNLMNSYWETRANNINQAAENRKTEEVFRKKKLFTVTSNIFHKMLTSFSGSSSASNFLKFHIPA